MLTLFFLFFFFFVFSFSKWGKNLDPNLEINKSKGMAVINEGDKSRRQKIKKNVRDWKSKNGIWKDEKIRMFVIKRKIGTTDGIMKRKKSEIVWYEEQKKESFPANSTNKMAAFNYFLKSSHFALLLFFKSAKLFLTCTKVFFVYIFSLCFFPLHLPLLSLRIERFRCCEEQVHVRRRWILELIKVKCMRRLTGADRRTKTAFWQKSF